MSYRVPLDTMFDTSSRLDLRVIGGYNPTRKTKANEGARPLQAANTGGNPKTKINFVANYANGPFSLNAQARYIGETQRTRDETIFFADNTVPAITYVDATVGYKFRVAEADLEAFLTVNNLLNKDAPFVPSTGQPGINYPTVQGLFDVVGRYYTTGIRFRF